MATVLLYEMISCIWNNPLGCKVVFRSLNIEALTEMPEMNKLNFLLAPDKYFGEKLAEKSSEDLKLPTLSASK